jgi:ribose 1,5-bisphosphokinase PhnN
MQTLLTVCEASKADKDTLISSLKAQILSLNDLVTVEKELSTGRLSAMEQAEALAREEKKLRKKTKLRAWLSNIGTAAAAGGAIYFLISSQ